MTALKAHEVEGFLRKPDPSARLILVHGPDHGLVTERADALAAAHLKGASDPFALVRLEGDAIGGDASRLADEVYTVALFGDRRVVRLRVGSRNIAPQVEAVVKGPPPEAVLIIEAGELKPVSPLRKLFEGARNAVALPCYPDEAAQLARLIEEELTGQGFTLSGEARKRLMEHLGGDRLASRQELRKIALYCHGRTSITEEDILAVSGDVSAIEVEAIVDAVALGELDAGVSAYRRLLAEGGNASMIAGAMLRHMHQLHAARAEIDRGRTLSDAIGALSPPVFYKRRPAFERQLVLWTAEKAERAAGTLDKAILDARASARLADTLVERALLSAASLARRR